MNKDNVKTLHKYLLEREANEISKSTRELDTFFIKKLDSYLKKPFEQITKEDMIHFVSHLTQRHYRPQYLHLIKNKLRVFFNWLYRLEPQTYPECVKWMRTNNPRSHSKSGGMQLPIKPKDILTQQEVLRLIEVSTHTRDQCMVIVAYETGGRAKEILNLKINSVQFSERAAYVTLEGNTGARRIPVVLSVPYLQTWLNVHPYRDNVKAYLFPPMKGERKTERMRYHSFLKMLNKLKREAQLSKPVRPHLLRHARLTELAKHLTDAQLKTYAGWTQGSRMTGVYVHLSGGDLDQPIFKMHGLAIEKTPKETPLKPKTCVRGHENSSTATYCKDCGLILDSERALGLMEKDEELKKKLAHEIEAKIRAEYEKKLQEQVKKAVKEEVRKYRHIVPHEVEAEYRRQAENWLYTKKCIREVKPDYIVYIDEDTGKKFIEVHGYWKDGKYSPIAPARIQL